jgi:CheY-like chemotaxis protein
MNATAPMRVFVVDDDCGTTECLRLLMRHWGHEVDVANQGSAAIEQAPRFKPDLMLVDLSMPVVDGFTVARRIREIPDLGATSLVALTGWSDVSHQQQALEAGFDECLLKPPPLDDLSRLLSRVASRIAQTRRLASAAVEAAATARGQNRRSREGLQQPVPLIRTIRSADEVPVSIRVQTSGISDLFVLADRELADKLRRWLLERGCRVGPVFEPSPGEVAFYTYSRRQARALLAAQPRFSIES